MLQRVAELAEVRTTAAALSHTLDFVAASALLVLSELGIFIAVQVDLHLVHWVWNWLAAASTCVRMWSAAKPVDALVDDAMAVPLEAQTSRSGRNRGQAREGELTQGFEKNEEDNEVPNMVRCVWPQRAQAGPINRRAVSRGQRRPPPTAARAACGRGLTGMRIEELAADDASGSSSNIEDEEER